MSATHGELIDAIEVVSAASAEFEEAREEAHAAGVKYQKKKSALQVALAHLDLVRGQVVYALPAPSDSN